MAFASKVALITRSTSGIGLGIARTLAKGGCEIILTGLGDEALIKKLQEEFKSVCNGRALFVPGDLQSRDSIRRMCEEVISNYPDGIDILVNNAGLNYVAPVEEYSEEKWDELISIMLTAPLLLIKNFLPYMKKKKWGRIVNISSMMGLISQEGKAVYSAAKSGLIGLARGVALEAAPFGVTCNTICPGFAYSAVTEPQIQTLKIKERISYDEAKDKFFSRAPTGKAVEIQRASTPNERKNDLMDTILEAGDNAVSFGRGSTFCFSRAISITIKTDCRLSPFSVYDIGG